MFNIAQAPSVKHLTEEDRADSWHSGSYTKHPHLQESAGFEFWFLGFRLSFLPVHTLEAAGVGSST